MTKRKYQNRPRVWLLCLAVFLFITMAIQALVGWRMRSQYMEREWTLFRTTIMTIKISEDDQIQEMAANSLQCYSVKIIEENQDEIADILGYRNPLVVFGSVLALEKLRCISWKTKRLATEVLLRLKNVGQRPLSGPSLEDHLQNLLRKPLCD